MSAAENESSSAASVWPISFAIGTAVLLVGLIVNPLVVTPLGGVIALLAVVGWVRGGQRTPRPAPAPTPASRRTTEAERFPRSRLLKRAARGLGALVALGAAVLAAAVAVLQSLLSQRRRPTDHGPIGASPKGSPSSQAGPRGHRAGAGMPTGSTPHRSASNTQPQTEKGAFR
jgi:hypothetical protein